MLPLIGSLDIQMRSIRPGHLVKPFNIHQLTIEDLIVNGTTTLNGVTTINENVIMATGKTIDGCDLDRVVNTIYSDSTERVATGTTAALPEYEETNVAYQTKIRIAWWKKTNAKTIVLKCQTKVDTVMIGNLQLVVGALSKILSFFGFLNMAWEDKVIYLDVTSLACGFHEIEIQLKGGNSSWMRYVEIIEVCNTSGTIC